MPKKNKIQKIETGDFVEIVAGEFEKGYGMVGFIGILDNKFMKDGVVMYAVISEADPDVFYYATEIKLYKKAN